MVDTIEGRNPVLEALRSHRPMSKILLARNIRTHGIIDEIMMSARSQGIRIEFVNREVINRLSQTSTAQGIIAFTTPKEYISLDETLEILKRQQEPTFLIILDGVEDPHNLGAILRTAEAVGAHAVIVREKRAAGLSAAVVKASAGAIEYVPVARVTNISRAIQILKQNNIWIVGVDSQGDENYSGINYRASVAIVIGSEGRGMSALVKQNCDFIARIPMKGKITSLNASIAASIVMYEVARQRDEVD